MNNRLYKFTQEGLLVLLTVVTLTLSCYGSDNTTMAVITKVIPDVEKKNMTVEWNKATAGVALVAGDRVRTGKLALAVIKFMDQSIMRLREQSELTLSAEGPRGSMIKTIELSSGGFGFDVRKQQNEQFRLTSPTSVASIRGTRGIWCGGRGLDTLLVLEGLVNLNNLISKRDIDVPAGFIGFSGKDGDLVSRRATEQELLRAAQIVRGNGLPGEIKLDMKDPQDNNRELKLKIKQ
jgi:hypothetical protein